VPHTPLTASLWLPPGFPRAPAPIVAALLAPFTWTYGRPDLVDSYSAGVLLMQLSVPQLRSSNNIRAFNAQLNSFECDLEAWRDYQGGNYDFAVLDR